MSGCNISPHLPFTAETVPVIETARLRLRRHRLDDFAACAAMWSDPEVTRFIGGKPSTHEEVWARILRYAGHWALLGFGYWAIEEKASGSFIGEVGLADFHRDIDPPMDDGPEVGWALQTASHGKGYGAEALRAALDWGHVHFGSEMIYCLIDTENRPSIRLAEKCGFKRLRQTTYRGTANIVFGRKG
jgi:RimJ/RimL family protein N-acetyltransferase